MRSQNKQTIQAQLAAKRSVVPVVVIERAEDALPLARAILAGGGISIEITLRTQAGLKAIEAIANSDLEIVVGAGTVLTVEDAKQAIAAGAQFLVSPGLDSEVVEYALAQEVLMIPGVMTPSEVLTAKRLGLEMLKFFPAQLAGGVGMLKTFASVFPMMRFMPTGGININNLPDYVKLNNVLAVGGSWVCEQSLIKEGRFDEITRLMQEAQDCL